MTPPRRGALAIAISAVVLARAARADSVVPIVPALTLSPLTASPPFQAGDILTFVLRLSTAPNGAQRGLAAYATVYVPAATEVVGARIVDASGRTAVPSRGGLASDGVGPRGPKAYSSPLVNGSLAQLLADTGIFYSTNPRTARRPVPTPGDPYITVFNGLAMPSSPTGAGQVEGFYGLNGPPYFAHNEWDLAQAMAFGVSGAVNAGNGNTPEHVGSSRIGYGSPVAGPQSWYGLEATVDPPGSVITTGSAKLLGNVGPWTRIRARGSLIGRRGAGDLPPTSSQTMPSPGLPTRVGTAALDGGDPLGWDLSADNPLPAGTNAVRFALGELVLGQEYSAEVSLRVQSLPLDAGNVLCAEVFAGDASSRDQGGQSGGKDNAWRYFVPIPSCTLLDLGFENKVDKVLAVASDVLNYTIEGTNRSPSSQENVVVRDCFRPADVAFVSATPGYVYDFSAFRCPNPANEDALVWNVGTWALGASFTFSIEMVAVSGGPTVVNWAVYTSDALPPPGYRAGAATVLGNYPSLQLDLAAAPAFLPTLPASVGYTAKVRNAGVGSASSAGCSGMGCYVEATLPAGFAFTPGSASVNGAPVANPSVSGQSVRFGSAVLPLTIAAGAVLTIAFDATVAGGTPAGLYSSELRSWLRGGGLDLEDVLTGAAPVAVAIPRSAAPLLSQPCQGGTAVSGTTAAPSGSTARAFVNGNPAGTGTTTGGGFSVTVPTLFAGQHVTATMQAVGELESPPSPPAVVSSCAGTDLIFEDGFE